MSQTEQLVSSSAAVSRLRAGSRRPGSVFTDADDVIFLNSGDPDFPTPSLVADAAGEAVREGRTRYGDLNGDPELRSAYADSFSISSARRYTEAETVITNGASSGAYAAITAVISPGDRVVLLDPTYSLFEAVTHMVGGVTEHVPFTDDGHLDLDRLDSALAGARLFVLVNPSNPDGTVFTRVELEHLAALTVKHGVTVISDEVCDGFVFDRNEFTTAAAIDAWQDKLIVCNSMSKTSAMSGWRIGCTVARRPLIDDIRLVHRNTLTAVNSISQRAALAAIHSGRPWIDQMRAEIQRRRDLTVGTLNSIPRLQTRMPEGGLFVFPRFDLPRTSDQVTQALFDLGVAVRSGREFGSAGEGHIRVSLTASEAQLNRGLERIKHYFDNAG